MTTEKREYLVTIFAAVYTAEDTEMEHASPTLIKVPVTARSPEEAQEKVGKALGKVAQVQPSSADEEEWKNKINKSAGLPVPGTPYNPTHPYNRPNRNFPGISPRQQPLSPWSEQKAQRDEEKAKQDMMEILRKFAKDIGE